MGLVEKIIFYAALIIALIVFFKLDTRVKLSRRIAVAAIVMLVLIFLFFFISAVFALLVLIAIIIAVVALFEKAKFRLK